MLQYGDGAFGGSVPGHRVAHIPAFERTTVSCPNPQLSCHNTTAVSNTCCFNAPGGQLLQTQFWDTSPSTGPSDSWTIHGLWPDHCDGTFDSFCDESRQYTDISGTLQDFGRQDLLDYMNTYWKDAGGDDETFWEHEWGKHGTCISTFDTDCYVNYQSKEELVDFLQDTVNLFKTLPTYQWLADAGITPSTSKTYTSAQIQSALESQRDGHPVTLGCSSGALDEVWYHFNVKGSVQTGQFVPSDPDGSKSTCPSTGIKYLPKSGSGGGSTTTTTSAGTSPTGSPFSGKGYVNVVNGGSQNGCLISAGVWYTSGTCATYTASSSGSGFTLSSSKGNCGVVSGSFTCGSSVSSPTVFTSSSSNQLTYSGSASWYASSVPSGSDQETVYSSSSGHSVTVQLQWQSLS
ncbi:ribonuclease T2 [Xylona heveae TC161]|uniref:Ribonuclease T2-like n=1 Tax=Xylona heveae (strain CBS 132557 / TC161) TaxID=1328760 RepID=A0A165ICU1_XYLHT|nr:ribonuclease T2 [Xylona heveae TC161]KZF24714.1 ribonuclease T2 [Xylona heveae TC161]